MKMLEADEGEEEEGFYFGVRPKYPGAEPALAWQRKIALIT